MTAPSSSAWGVRMERVGGALLVAPSGVLDGEQADRLRRVLRSREAGYACVVLDLRDLEGIGAGGADLLNELRSRADAGAHDIAFVVGTKSRGALDAIGLTADLTLAEDLEVVLAPYRAS